LCLIAGIVLVYLGFLRSPQELLGPPIHQNDYLREMTAAPPPPRPVTPVQPAVPSAPAPSSQPKPPGRPDVSSHHETTPAPAGE